MSMKRKEDKVSLVLTIFKGENFVCKSPQGIRCQVEARCNDQILHTGVVPVTSTNSEPSFNFQLAWQLTRKELRELREQKVPVKVSCLLYNGDDRPKPSLGYAVLHVKDAFPCAGMTEMDASKALSCSLLGLKDEWKMFSPRLHMQLHIEDKSIVEQSKSPTVGDTRKSLEKTKEEKQTYRNHVPPVLPNVEAIGPAVDLLPIEPNVAIRFSWTIGDDGGFFQLERPTRCDDLYSLNVTVVSVSNLHLLWNGHSPRKASDKRYVWQIKYQAYGCEIRTDPFILNDADPTRRTFLGDKASARIRAYPPQFCEYLEETVLEFHVVRFELSSSHDLVNEEIMGVAFAELMDLAKGDKNEVKLTVDVVSELGYVQTISSSTEKPEIRLSLHQEATPGYFADNKNEAVRNIDAETDNVGNDNDVHIPQRLEQLAGVVTPSKLEAHREVEGDDQEENENDNDQVDLGQREVDQLNMREAVLAAKEEEREKAYQEKMHVLRKQEKNYLRLVNSVGEREEKIRFRELEEQRKIAEQEQVSKDLNANEQIRRPHSHSRDSQRDWEAERKADFEEELKKKEKAYLKVLADEAASRDEQRENFFHDKLAEVQKKETEVSLRWNTVSLKEDEIRTKEAELKERAQQLELENRAVVEDNKLKLRTIQEEYKFEMTTMKRTNDQDFAEMKRLRGRLAILEARLEEKDDIINNLKADRHKGLDFQHYEKLNLLESEKRLMQRQIKELENTNQELRKQAQQLCVKLAKVQEEKDKQMKEENNSLRLQILATKEHKEMKKERKAVSSISNQIRSLQDGARQKRTPCSSSSNRTTHNGTKERNNHELQKDSPVQNLAPSSSSQEAEIQRLTQTRNDMLKSGAYTRYDLVIKEMEKKIFSLASTMN